MLIDVPEEYKPITGMGSVYLAALMRGPDELCIDQDMLTDVVDKAAAVVELGRGPAMANQDGRYFEAMPANLTEDGRMVVDILRDNIGGQVAIITITTQEYGSVN